MQIINLNKDFIFEYVSQEKIFEDFLNIKVEFDVTYKSPFRNNDKNNSCSFKYNSRGVLKFKDFGGATNCDCFELVGILYGINCNNGQGFMAILNIIAKHYNLIEGSNLEKRIAKQETFVETKKKISPKITDFNYNDFQYWKRGNINAALLKKARIYKCKLLFIDDDLIYAESYSNPAYVYVFTKTDFRIYFPLSKKNKFITTSNCIQGGHLLEYKQDFVIINKSYKDALSLSTFFLEGKNIESFGLGSETTLIPESSMEHLKSKYKYIFTLTDYDPAGLHCAWIHRKKYGTIPLFIKNKTWNSGEKAVIKDFWDLVVNLGVERTQKIIDLNYEKMKLKYGRK